MTREGRRRNMTLAIIVAIGTVVSGTFGAGNVLSLAAIKVGADNMFLGVLSFVSIAPFVLSLLTMSTIEKTGKIKILWVWYSVAAIFTALFLLFPFVAKWWPVWASLTLLAVASVLRNSATALGSTGWFPLLQDMVPRQYTGRFFARLRTSWQTANVICLIAAAIILSGEPGWMRFQILFVLALIGQIIAVLPLLKMTENPPAPITAPTVSIYLRLKDFIAQKEMRYYTLYSIAYMLAAAAMEPFKIKLLTDLGYSYGFVLAATAMVGLGAVLSLRFWGVLADKFGNRSIFSTSQLGMVLCTAMWILVSAPSTTGKALVLGLYLLWSVFNSGTMLAHTNYMFRVVPPNCQNDMNFITLAQRIAAATAPLAAGLFLHFTGDRHIGFTETFRLDGYDVLFLLNAAAFIIPFRMRKRLKAKSDVPTSQVVALVIRPIRDTIIYTLRPLRLPKRDSH